MKTFTSDNETTISILGHLLQRSQKKIIEVKHELLTGMPVKPKLPSLKSSPAIHFYNSRPTSVEKQLSSTPSSPTIALRLNFERRSTNIFKTFENSYSRATNRGQAISTECNTSRICDKCFIETQKALQQKNKEHLNETAKLKERLQQYQQEQYELNNTIRNLKQTIQTLRTGQNMKKLELQIKTLQVEKEIIIKEQESSLLSWREQHKMMSDHIKTKQDLFDQEVTVIKETSFHNKNLADQVVALENQLKEHIIKLQEVKCNHDDSTNQLKGALEISTLLSQDTENMRDQLYILREETQKVQRTIGYIISNQDPPLDLLLRAKRSSFFSKKTPKLQTLNQSLNSQMTCLTECKTLLKDTLQYMSETIMCITSKFVSKNANNLISFV